MTADLTLSIISADNLDFLLPCLRSVFEHTHEIDLEVYVVDNASEDGTTKVVHSEFPQVKVITNETRMGFSTNNNMVLRQGQGRYLMLLNDDTVVLEGSLDQMVRFMDENSQVGALGSFLLNPDGSFQPSFARFPRPIMEALWPVMNWYHRLVRDTSQPFEVDSVHGAAMVVRREVIYQVGVLDTAFDPIYSEEVDWCYRIKKAEWDVCAFPQARITHYGGQTMNRMLPHKYELLLSHKMLYFRKHAGRKAALTYRTMLALSTAAKALWWTSMVLLPIDKQMAREKRQLHWHLLKRIPSF